MIPLSKQKTQYATKVAHRIINNPYRYYKQEPEKCDLSAKKSHREEYRMGSNKRANSFLKECMADALIGLMKEKDFSKITINEIAVAAGVNRSTWFRNFDSKSEALTFKLVQLWLCWAEEHGLSQPYRYTVDNAFDFFCFNHENRQLVDRLLTSGLEMAVYEAFYTILMPQFDADAAQCYENRFYSYALFGLLCEWSKRGYHETPEEMTAIFYKIMG